MFFDPKLAERLDIPRLKDAISMLSHLLAQQEAKESVANSAEIELVRDGKANLVHIARRRLHQQHSRQRYLPQEIFRDPAWNILLDLFVNDLQGIRVCVTDACLASGAAPTTALRWIRQLETLGLVKRRKDTEDARRYFVSLTDAARQDIRRWLREDC